MSKKLLISSLLLLNSSIALASDVGTGGNCGTAIFQIQNELNTNATLSGVTGFADVMNTLASADQTTQIASLSTDCSDAVCIGTINKLSAGSSCQLENLQLKFELSPDNNYCQISIQSASPAQGSTCYYCPTEQSGTVSYPTLSLNVEGC